MHRLTRLHACDDQRRHDISEALKNLLQLCCRYM